MIRHGTPVAISRARFKSERRKRHLGRKAEQGSDHDIAAFLNAQSRGNYEGRCAQREGKALQNQSVRPRQGMAHEPEANPGLAGADDPAGKMQHAPVKMRR